MFARLERRGGRAGRDGKEKRRREERGGEEK